MSIGTREEIAELLTALAYKQDWDQKTQSRKSARSRTSSQSWTWLWVERSADRQAGWAIRDRCKSITFARTRLN